MNAILLSIKPEWLEKILNGEKTIEIRKSFPKDYKGWVYLYCTKDGGTLLCGNAFDEHNWITFYGIARGRSKKQADEIWDALNGKVVARFYCGNVEEINDAVRQVSEEDFERIGFETESVSYIELQNESCLSNGEIYDYLNNGIGYAIPIFQLEKFDKPKELSDFIAYYTRNDLKHNRPITMVTKNGVALKPLTKAPQNYCYIEV